MKDCKDCEYFDGYNYDDGTPNCDLDGGYESCPFNDSSVITNKGMKIEIDSEFMSDYIRNTLQNTISCETIKIAEAEIKKLITDELKELVKEETERQVQAAISAEISQFLQKEITVGGGWSGPERKLTREQYLAETIENELKSRFESDAIKKYAQTEAKRAIDEYAQKMRIEVNNGIKTYFDAATRETLTQNIVSMLMDNATYKKLSESLNTFLPGA